MIYNLEITLVDLSKVIIIIINNKAINRRNSQK